jgi:hypothetical protein
VTASGDVAAEGVVEGGGVQELEGGGQLLVKA